MSTTTRDVDIEIPGQLNSHKEPAQRSWLKKVGKVVLILLRALLLFCQYFPLTILSITFGWRRRPFIPGANQREDQGETESSSPGKSSIYKKKLATEKVQTTIQQLGVVIATRLGVLGILWLIVNLSVPSLRKAPFLGDPLWKWSVLVILIFLLIPSMLIMSYIFTEALEWGSNDEEEEEVDIELKLYWIRGVAVSMRWVFYFALILLMWILYFEIKPPRQRLHHNIYKDIHKYIILTLLGFLLWTVIGLIANILVLLWKKRVIYTPTNKVRILVGTFRLYVLLLMFGNIKEREVRTRFILMPYLDRGASAEKCLSMMTNQDLKMTSLMGNPVRRPPIERFMEKMSKYVSLYEINEAISWLMQHFDLSEEEIPDLQQLLPAIRQKYRSSGNPQNGPTADVIIHANVVSEDLREFLLQLLRLDLKEVQNYPNEGEQINWRVTKTWMKFAHKRCFAYMHKLHGDLQLADTLQRVLFAFQIVAAVILWLFITKLATKELVITLGSLLLGLSFMFIETCRTFFHGVVFSFIIHPFDVGDRVKIKNTKLEVRKMYILTTSFRKEKPKDEIIIYPNSAIAKEKIIRLKKDEGVSHKNDGDSNADDT